jgi:hypothetical protein
MTERFEISIESGKLSDIAQSYNLVDYQNFFDKSGAINVPVTAEEFVIYDSCNWPARLEFIKNKLGKSSFAMSSNVCDGKKDGISGCRDCCQENSNNNYKNCVDSCMTSHKSNFKMGKKICSNKGILTSDAVKKLKKLASQKDGDTHSEKGGLLKYAKKGNVYYFDLDDKSLIKGESAETDVPDGIKGKDRCKESCAGFHTHPHQEYVVQNVVYAWPSGDDYQAFLEKIIDKTSFLHFVIAKEGYYIISLHPNAIAKGEDFIKKSKKRAKKYKFSLPSSKSEGNPNEYKRKLDSIPEEEKVFHVEFKKYNTAKPFSFYFPTENSSCEM